MLAPAWCTYPFLVHHNVVAPVLLGQVWGQDVKAPPELRKHHVVGVPWGEQGRVGLWGSQDAWGMALCALTGWGPSFGTADGVTPRGTSSPRGQAWLECPDPPQEVFLGRVLQQFWLRSGEEVARSCLRGSAGTRVLPVQVNRPCSNSAERR